MLKYIVIQNLNQIYNAVQHLSIANGFVSPKLYDKHDDFDINIVNFPFLDGDVPRRPCYGVYIYQLIRFARVYSHVEDLNARDKC